jgi:3-methyladenine DNA glycosylase/8-oxoguanine DNA glycosylase
MSKALPTPDEMRARFWELKAERNKIDAKREGPRAAYDELVAKHEKERAAAAEKVKKAEAGLFDIDQEMAALVRAVGGKMGEPPSEG